MTDKIQSWQQPDVEKGKKNYIYIAILFGFNDYSFLALQTESDILYNSPVGQAVPYLSPNIFSNYFELNH